MEEFPNNENINQGEQETKPEEEVKSFEEHMAEINGASVGDSDDEDDEYYEMSDEEIGAFLDELPKKQEEWAKANKDKFEEYVAEGKGYLFLNPDYTEAASAKLFESDDYKLEQITEFIREKYDYNGNKEDAWKWKIDGLTLDEQEVYDLASSNNRLDLWGDEEDAIESEKELIEKFKRIPSVFPGVISFWLKHKPEAFAISDDPEIIKKISEHSLDIAKSVMNYENPFEIANIGDGDPTITYYGDNPNYYVVNPGSVDWDDNGYNGEVYISKRILNSDEEITPNDIVIDEMEIQQD